MYSSHTTLAKRYKALSGFTLIEVLIVVAIVGILAAIAYPQYGNYVQKSRRSDGHLTLLQEIQNLERCKAANYSYTGCTLSRSTSLEGNYTMTLTGHTATTYLLTVTGTGSQASDTDCKVMTINQLGVRTPAASKNCWPN